MRLVAFLLRMFCYLFHIVLSLFLLGIGLVAKLSSATSTFYTPVLPGEAGGQAGYAILMGLTGLLAVFLAATGRFRPLLALWALAVVVLFFRGFFWGSYTYSGRDEFETVLWYFAATVLAFAGSVMWPGKRRPPAF